MTCGHATDPIVYVNLQMSKLPSLQDIADAVGVSKMTVSLSLRDHPRIPVATRERIKAAAEKLGYKPNPEVAQLMSVIRKHKPNENGLPLAYITTGANQNVWRESPTELAYWNGACQRAKSYGYYIEEYWLEKPLMSARRLSDILWNRGIMGVIIPPVFRTLTETSRNVHLDLKWDRFCAVTIGDPLTSPQVNRVVHDHYSSTLTAMTRLQDLGYRRIGLFLREHMDLTVNQRWQAGYRVFRANHPVEHIEPLIIPELDAARVKQWIKKNRIDALLSADRNMPDFFNQMGIRMGEEVAYADLDVVPDDPIYKDVGGIVQNSELLGMAAVDILVAAVQRGQTGVPKVPFVTQVEGYWLERGSTPPKH